MRLGCLLRGCALWLATAVFLVVASLAILVTGRYVMNRLFYY